MPRVRAHIKPVIDDRGEGTDDGAQTCRIHTVQKGGQIIGKRVKDNGSRYVGDDLAQTDPPEILVAGNGVGKKVRDRLVRSDLR